MLDLRVQPDIWLEKNLNIPKRPLTALRGYETYMEWKKEHKKAPKNLKT
jgi:hypothetical protein